MAYSLFRSSISTSFVVNNRTIHTLCVWDGDRGRRRRIKRDVLFETGPAGPGARPTAMK